MAETAAPRFAFYEIVRVATDDVEYAAVNGELGAVVGQAEPDADGHHYGVYVYRDQECWDIPECCLAPTGVRASRADLYDDQVIRVRVDEHGRGWPV